MLKDLGMNASLELNEENMNTARRQMSLSYHPDKNQEGAEKFTEFQERFLTLEALWKLAQRA